ncbi:ca2+ h+-exchanging protein [Ophiostoma piceae UAMH 11346]|uniref:Ca2+ h+-exchanging protein n=1 Tax=Ophiostoma piceae (strain UAMH 11346) TaxID=1262450 RepID=S3C9Q3_OPHP1|nr:ca2+ h+-exchanging protein [Ophiostoma piceae UAMH 11346]
MKKSSSAQPDSDQTRLSPTQADGDLFRLSRTSPRRPNSDSLPDQDRAGLPTSLSESHDLDIQEKKTSYFPDNEKKQQKQRHDEKKEHGITACDGVNSAGDDNANSTKPTFSRNSSNNTDADASAAGSRTGSTADTVSATPASVSPLQDAWSGSVLGVDGDKEKKLGQGEAKERKDKEKLPGVSFTANNTTNSSGSGSNTEIAGDITGAETAADPSVDPPKTFAEKSKALAVDFVYTAKMILLHSWLNVFLIFVPAGIIVAAIPDVKPVIVFSLNAIAIIPLAGLLGYATETVAHRMGDSIGALLNVTFGNAVELIIFIALVKDEIRIVQASLLGSILANLLLILGMGFLLGGLRFREQMSACLLSLSVISLVLPTAFHASFADSAQADRESLKISRGTSVLKSHAYMYESTPQHIIDLEATPGPAAGWLDSSSSDDSSSSSSDSDSSGRSRDTMKKRMRRVIRGGRRRKSSVASLDTVESQATGPTRTASFSTLAATNEDNASEDVGTRPPPYLRSSAHDANANDEAIDEDDAANRRHKRRRGKRSLRRYRRHHRKRSNSEQDTNTEDTILENTEATFYASPTDTAGGPSGVYSSWPSIESSSVGGAMPGFDGETRRVDFAIADPAFNGSGNVDQHGNLTGPAAELASARRAFNLRAMSSLRPVAKSLAPTVFTQTAGAPGPSVTAGPIPRVRYGIRRTNSLPDSLIQNQQHHFRAPGAMFPSQIPLGALDIDYSGMNRLVDDEDNGEFTMSRRAAIFLLLFSTGLVAACAEFMVDSINGLVETSSVGEVFIGLIILPIVGNAAEHVTAVMVAMKNKMDLAIGVAVGSSIQIALFMTPLVVILGWIIDRDMTLYFTLFETVCLFVSAFIVNFLVLDGRSNYLEGALLCSTYVIIGLVAFFYPKPEDASKWG